MKKTTILAVLALGGITNAALAQNTINDKAQQRIAILCNQINPLQEIQSISHETTSDEIQPQKYALLEKFTQKYAPPKEMCEIIEKNKEKIITSEEHIIKLDSFFVKYAHLQGYPKEESRKRILAVICRLINAERMREYIQRNNLTCLDVAKKYVYKIDDHWVTIAEAIQQNDNSSILSLPEVQQLYQLAQGTGYADWGFCRTNNTQNWIRDIRNKLVCIDTEDTAFFNYDGLDTHNLLNCFSAMSLQAYLWVIKQCITLQSINDNTELPNVTTFDDPEMNFEEVKRQAHAMKNEKTKK